MEITTAVLFLIAYAAVRFALPFFTLMAVGSWVSHRRTV